MHIHHLDQSVYTFINTQLPVGVGYHCYMAFYLAEQLGLKDYDRSFVDLVSIDDGVERDTIRDLFVEKVTRLVQECIEEHKITLNEDCECTLEELNELLHFIELVQRLEDYDAISLRLHGLGTPKVILADIVSQLTSLQVWKVLEMVESVHEDFLEAIRHLIKDRQVDLPQAAEQSYRLSVQVLQDFVGDNSCLGMTMYESGYKHLDWNTLIALTPLDLNEHFTKTYQISVAQCAIDLVSLALVCKDTYQTPAMHLQKVLPLYLEHSEDVTKVYTAIMAMLVDYQTLKDATLQQLNQPQGTV